MGAVGFDEGGFLLQIGPQDVFFAFAVATISGIVMIGTERVAEIESERVSPECGIDNGDIVLGNLFGVVAVVLVETFFEGVVHGVDGGLAVGVAVDGVDVGLLDKEENEKQRGKRGDDDELDDGKTSSVIHKVIIA